MEITKVNPFPALQVLQISQNFPQEQPLVLTWGTFAQTKRTTGQPIQGSYHPSAQVSKTSHPKGCIPRGEGRGKISSVEVSCIALPTEPWTEGSNRNMCGPNPNKSLATSDPNPLSLCASLHKLPRCKDAPWRRKDLDSERWNPCVPFWEFEPSLFEPGGSQFPGGGSAPCACHMLSPLGPSSTILLCGWSPFLPFVPLLSQLFPVPLPSFPWGGGGAKGLFPFPFN